MSDIHVGHRARVRRRFLAEGLDHFEEHQILELLLFYTIPQRDTNVLAHELLRRFGTLADVLDAPMEELVKLDGVGESTAVFLKLLPAVFRRYEQDRLTACSCYDTLDKVGEFACRLFVGVTVEQAYLLLFNNRMEMLDCQMIAQGSVNQAPILPREVTRLALLRDASGAILVHNHPSGLAVPSAEDVSVTHELDAACKLVGVRLIEHLVVAGHDFVPILRAQKGSLRTSPSADEADRLFYRNFYGNP